MRDRQGVRQVAFLEKRAGVARPRRSARGLVPVPSEAVLVTVLSHPRRYDTMIVREVNRLQVNGFLLGLPGGELR